MIKYIFYPGRIENTQLVINCGLGSSVWSMPYSLIQAVISTSQMLYKSRNRAIHIVNAPKTFSVVWKVVSNFVDEFTANKVQISHSNIS